MTGRLPVVSTGLLALTVLSAPAVAAAQDAPAGRPVLRGQTAVQGTIGAPGAVLELSSGARLEVAGAAATGQTVSLAEAQPDPRPWPWTADFRRVGTALRTGGLVRGSQAPAAITIPVATRPVLRAGERLVVVVEHVADHEAHGAEVVAGPVVQAPSGADPRAAGSIQLSIINLPRPATGGDPRAGAIIEPDILRIPTGGSAGGDRAGASIDPLIVRIPRSGGGTRITYWSIGTARLDATGRSLSATIPFDGELRAVSFGVTSWDPSAGVALR